MKLFKLPIPASLFISERSKLCLRVLLISIFVTAVRINGNTFRIPTQYLLLIPIFLWLSSRRSHNIYFFSSSLFFLVFLYFFQMSLVSLTIPSFLAYLPVSIIPYGIYYILVWTISLTISQTIDLKTLIIEIVAISRFILVIGVFFWFLSVGSSLPVMVDESASIFRLSSLMSEPSYIAIPASVLLCYGLTFKDKTTLLFSLFASALTFSPTVLLVQIWILTIFALRVTLKLILGIIKTNSLNLKSLYISFALLIAILTPVLIYTDIINELYQNIDSFLSSGTFLDGRATNAYNFYKQVENINNPFGFGIGSSEMVGKTLGYSGVFDNSILVSFDMIFGSFFGFILKVILALTILSFAVFYISFKSFDSNLMLSFSYLFSSSLLFSFIGNFSQPYLPALIILLIVVMFKNSQGLFVSSYKVS